MRSAPSLDSDVIQKVPYGTKVTLMDNKSFGLDTITTIKTETQEHQITGHWVLAKHKGKTGYLISSYLKVDPTKWRIYDLLGKKATEYNNEYKILRPGFDCGYNFVEKSNYNWYGLYATDTTSWVEPISFEFVNRINSMTDHGIVAVKDKDLLYIIGSKKKLNSQSHISKKGAGKITYPESEIYYQEKCDTEQRFSPYFKTVFTKNWVENYCKPYNVLTINKEDQSQEISPESFTPSMWIKRVEYIGDIDGDQREDYIIYQTNEKSYMFMLYLSSERNKENPLLKLVAYYSGGPCC